jgi:hypothetical protein
MARYCREYGKVQEEEGREMRWDLSSPLVANTAMCAIAKAN